MFPFFDLLVVFWFYCVFLVVVVLFFGFSWVGFARIWRLASFLSYTTVLCISLIELSVFGKLYCSWQLMPHLLGLVLVYCFFFFANCSKAQSFM